jgi:hypothetical protein
MLKQMKILAELEAGCPNVEGLIRCKDGLHLKFYQEGSFAPSKSSHVSNSFQLAKKMESQSGRTLPLKEKNLSIC